MNLQRLFSQAIISMMALAVLHLPCPAQTAPRENVLAKYFPEGMTGLSEDSRKVALKYVAAWMSSMSFVSAIGLENPDRLKDAYEKELLPILLPLKDGDKAEKEAFAAGIKIYEALNYLALKLTGKADKQDASLEALLRYKPGNEKIGGRVTEGVGEMYFDYMQMLDPGLFEKMYQRYQSQQP